MKSLKSKLFQKFENNEVKNLSRITGGSWDPSYQTKGGVRYHVDSIDSNTLNGGVIPSGDYKTLS